MSTWSLNIPMKYESSMGQLEPISDGISPLMGGNRIYGLLNMKYGLI